MRLPSLPVLFTLLLITESLHNLEEGIFMKAFLEGNVQNPLRISYPFDYTAFLFSLVLFTLLFYYIIFWYKAKSNQFNTHLSGAIVILIGINILFPHALFSLFYLQYSPGIFSGLVLNLPVVLLILISGFRNKIWERKLLFKYTLFVIPFAVFFIWISMLVGDLIL